MERRRGIGGAGESRRATLRGDRIEEQFDRRDRHVDVEGLEDRRVEHPEARQHGLGPKPQGGRLAGVELRPRLAHDLQVVDRRPGLGQQG